MSDNKSKKMDDVLDDIEKNLKKHAHDFWGEYGCDSEIDSIKSAIKSNLGKTKDTADEKSYEAHIRKLDEKFSNLDKTLGDAVSCSDMLDGVKKDIYKGFEHLKSQKKTPQKSEEKSKNKINEKLGIKKRNRLMPTRIGKKVTLKQKIALILSDGIIMKVPFVEQFVNDQLKSINPGKTKTVSSKSMRRKMLESLGFKGVSHSKAKASEQKAKTRTAQQSQGR